MVANTSQQMGRYRAILTDTDRQNIAGKDDPSAREVDQSVYRARQRINEELAHDIEILEEYRPDLASEMRDVVCNE